MTPSAQFNPQQVSDMAFRLHLNKGSQLQTLEQSQLNAIEAEISQRFAQAGYAINSTAKQPTHELAVSVGKQALTNRRGASEEVPLIEEMNTQPVPNTEKNSG